MKNFNIKQLKSLPWYVANCLYFANANNWAEVASWARCRMRNKEFSFKSHSISFANFLFILLLCTLKSVRLVNFIHLFCRLGNENVKKNLNIFPFSLTAAVLSASGGICYLQINFSAQMSLSRILQPRKQDSHALSWKRRTGRRWQKHEQNWLREFCNEILQLLRNLRKAADFLLDVCWCFLSSLSGHSNKNRSRHKSWPLSISPPLPLISL